MLCRTFVHAPGIGSATEQALWADGITTWSDFLQIPSCGWVRASDRDSARRVIEESVRRAGAGDWQFFDRCLSHAVKWRAFGELGDRPLYLDIETDGSLSTLTVLGLYDGRRMQSFIAGQNLHDAVGILEAAPLLISYNGAGFDLPVLLRQFPRLKLNAIHIDLMYPLRRLGFRGGLKAIETRMGIRRSPETDGLCGWDAVRLWEAACAGEGSALDTLVAYNAEDVMNLEPLMRHVYQTGCDDIARFAPAVHPVRGRL